MKAAQSDLGQIAGLKRGSLTVGTFPTLAGSFLPIVIRTFKKRYPAIGLSLRSARFDELVADLESGVTGLCLLWDYPWNRFEDEAIRVTEVFQESTVILVARGHKLAGRDQVSMEDLRNESWIVRAEAHPVVEVLQRSAHDAGFEPSIGFLANDYQEAQAMVSVGMGVAMVPKTAVSLQHPDVRVLSLGHGRATAADTAGAAPGQGLRPGRSCLPFHPAGNRTRAGWRLPVIVETGADPVELGGGETSEILFARRFRRDYRSVRNVPYGRKLTVVTTQHRISDQAHSAPATGHACTGGGPEPRGSPGKCSAQHPRPWPGHGFQPRPRLAAVGPQPSSG
jgi:DNA-binding transcriptional LysR family regulator